MAAEGIPGDVDRGISVEMENSSASWLGPNLKAISARRVSRTASHATAVFVLKRKPDDATLQSTRATLGPTLVCYVNRASRLQVCSGALVGHVANATKLHANVTNDCWGRMALARIAFKYRRRDNPSNAAFLIVHRVMTLRFCARGRDLPMRVSDCVQGYYFRVLRPREGQV